MARTKEEARKAREFHLRRIKEQDSKSFLYTIDYNNLQKLTRQELQDISKFFELKGLGTLNWSKQEYIDYILSKKPTAYEFLFHKLKEKYNIADEDLLEGAIINCVDEISRKYNLTNVTIKAILIDHY